MRFLSKERAQIIGAMGAIHFVWKKGVDGAGRVIKSCAYWTLVILAGLSLAGVIMHFSGVPVAMPVYAGGVDTATKAVLIFILKIVYYFIGGPIGMLNLILAYFLEQVMEYPYAGVWATSVSTNTSVAQTGGFVNVAGVQTGWKLVRDICNIFFALILAIIALATVLRIQAYSWKQLLPKLILMAVLINFSRSIAGIFTDFANVAMATFSQGFSGSFMSGLVSAFGLPGFTEVVSDSQVNETVGETQIGTIILAYLTAILFQGVFFVVMLVFLITLVFRIAMLWFLIVLSPLAYITRIIPQTEKYSGQWWEMFGRYVVVGPLVTFFLWLSLSIAFGAGEGSTFTQGLADTKLPGVTGQAQTLTGTYLSNFIIATMMLMASLKLITSMAQEAGKLTGAGLVAGGLVAYGASRLLPMMSQMIKPRVQKDASGHGIYRDGKPVYAPVSHFFSRLGAVAGVLGQPVEYAKQAFGGVTAFATERQHSAHAAARARVSEMRQEKVLGAGMTGSQRVGAALANTFGIMAMPGTEPETFMRGYGSIMGLSRMAQKVWALTGGRDYSHLEVMDQAAQDRQRDHEKEKRKLTAEEAPDTERQYEALRGEEGHFRRVANDLDLNNTVEIDLQDSAWRVAIEAHIDELQNESGVLRAAGNTADADAVLAQSEKLASFLQNGEFKDSSGGVRPMTTNDLYHDYSGRGVPMHARLESNFRKTMSQTAKDRAKAARHDRGELKIRMRLTGYKFDNLGSIFASGTGYKTADSEKQAEETAHVASHQADKLRRRLAALEIGESYEERADDARLIAEEMKKLSDMHNSQEVEDWVDKAEREGNIYLWRAGQMRIVQLGDDNEQLQDRASVDENGRVDPLAQTDGVGLENMRRRRMIGTMGMTASQAFRQANDMSFAGEQIGHLGLGRKYMRYGGQWRVMCDEIESQRMIPDPRNPALMIPNPGFNPRCAQRGVDKNERAHALLIETLKGPVTNLQKINRLGWGYEDPFRKFRANEMTRGLALGAGSQLQEERIWTHTNRNLKQNLVKVMGELREWNADARLLQKLSRVSKEVDELNNRLRSRRLAA